MVTKDDKDNDEIRVGHVGARNTEEETSLELERQRQSDYINDALSTYIVEKFTEARDYRVEKGVDAEFDYCLLAYKSKYSKEDLCKFEGIDVYRGISGMLARTAENWLIESFSLVQDRPWVLEATPMPDLPPDIQLVLDEAIGVRMQEVEDSGQLYLMGSMERADIRRELRKIAVEMANQQASHAVEGMQTLIHDQMYPAKWRKNFRKIIKDVAVYPTAVMKGPVVRNVRKFSHGPDGVEEVYEPTMVVERVAPQDFFPSPDSEDCQEGSYCVERMRYTRAALADMRGDPNCSKQAIELVLYDDREGVSDDGKESDERERMEIRDPDSPDLYLVYDFHGRVSGDDILSFLHQEDEMSEAMEDALLVDTDELGEIDPYGTYEINAWVCGGKVVRLVVDPYPLGRRPYQSASYVEVPGSFWGMCPATIVKGSQDEINAAARSRVFNMGIASGPTVEIDTNRMSKEDRPESIEPWRIYYTDGNTGAGAQPVIRYHKADSNAQELTYVMEEIWNKAHDLVGLPPYTRGSAQGSARTFGAFSLMYNSATKGIKRVIGNIDEGIVEEVVTGFFNMNMVYHPEDYVKADAQVVARGAVGLVRREQAEAKPLETLQPLMPFLSQFPEVMTALVTDFIKLRGYDPGDMGLTSNFVASVLKGQQQQPGGAFDQPPAPAAAQALMNETMIAPEG